MRLRHYIGNMSYPVVSQVWFSSLNFIPNVRKLCSHGSVFTVKGLPLCLAELTNEGGLQNFFDW